MPKSSENLRKEIASLEFEILRTEQYLLSLYRTAFDEQVTSFSPHTETSLVSNQFGSRFEKSDLTGVFSYHYQASPVSERSSSCPRSFQALSARGNRSVSGNHTTLGDLLGSSHIVDDIVNPSRLSEDILRCISSVYCTLSSKARTTSCLKAASSSSPLSSVSSKTNFDSWSPCLVERKDANVPCGVVIGSLKLHLDDGSFNYAALMLQNFRSLVQKLEKVDPSRMKREEKLAFWINIHNALTMHAYLAYGTHNRARTTSVLKGSLRCWKLSRKSLHYPKLNLRNSPAFLTAFVADAVFAIKKVENVQCQTHLRVGISRGVGSFRSFFRSFYRSSGSGLHRG